MLRFRACPRCRGDLAQSNDHYGSYVFCIQCGYQRNEVEERGLQMPGRAAQGAAHLEKIPEADRVLVKAA